MTSQSVGTEVVGAAAANGNKLRSLDEQYKRLGRYMTLPAQLLLVFIVAFPLVMQLYVSMTFWSPLDGETWVHAYKSLNWFYNYVDLVTNERFWGSIGRTLVIMAVVVPVEFLIGFGLATLFVESFPGKRIFYSILLMPMMIVPAVAGYMFFMIFQSNGPLNQILGIETVWLGDPNLAMVAVMIADIWQWSPLMFLILLAGILGVPEDQLKAATLLGANWRQKFVRIVLPRMKTVIIIALVIRAVESFKLFDLMFIMTKGGPGVATETISVWIFKLTFNDLDWSYVAAVGITILIALSVLAVIGLTVMARANQKRSANVVD